MQPKVIPENLSFLGREHELRRLREIAALDTASIVVVHGRRRVGKTELIEQCFRKRNILKFEGIEGQPPAFQRRMVLRQLAQYVGDMDIASLRFSTWIEVFEYIARYVAQGTWTLFFEEVQWLSSYKSDFVSELKYVWDNKFRYNDKLLLILCGSSPSFMIGKVLKSKALYNRSMHEIPLREFSLRETREFMGGRHSQQEVMDAYLSVGGIPEYLKYLKQDSSVLLALCRHSFVSGGFFTAERERVFVSSLSSNANYAAIVEFLSRRRYATRPQIAAHLKIDAGGSFSGLLTDLELCHFINRFTPFNLDGKSKLARYAVCDQYLQFYYKFIGPRLSEIVQGKFNVAPLSALSDDAYYTWLGFAFERYCRAASYKLAALLGFGAVKYDSGAFFSRATEEEDPNYQIDLVFDRADRVYTLCEIKYLRKPASKRLIEEFERKLELFPNPQKRSIHKVLIAAHGAEPALADSGYFDRIVTLEDIFAMER